MDNPNDCHDAEPLAWTGADEVCDGVDNDCEGTVGVGATDAAPWYPDDDGDGFGAAAGSVDACGAPPGFVADSTDRDDTQPLARTGADEVCDGVDNDCDGVTDNADAIDADTWYADEDGDGFDDPSVSAPGCTAPPGHVDNDGDCDDAEPEAWTGAGEVCDGVDNDCDGGVDDDATDAQIWSADADGDGYSDPTNTVESCDPPAGFADASPEADCDDTDPTVHPGAEEVGDDGIDQDCDGADLPGVAPPPEDKEGCGCATTGEGTVGTLGMLLVWLAAIRSRPREGQRTAPETR